MIKLYISVKDSETDFDSYERNRMYPPNHSGENMITLNKHHLMAIARGIHFVRSGITEQMPERLIGQIDRDIQLMHEANTYILQQIKEPGLPMIPESIGQGNKSEKDGHEDKPAAN